MNFQEFSPAGGDPRREFLILKIFTKMNTQPALPPLPLEEWEQTKITLHLYLQILGKIQLALMPRKNHWWNITDLVCPVGITTHDIPYTDEKETFQITLNILQHRLEVCTSKNEYESFPNTGRLKCCGIL